MTKGQPLHQSRAIVVLMHGRGRDTNDIMLLADRINDPTLTYLAPAARDHSWYPASFLEPIEKNEPYLSDALEVYDDIITGLLGQGIARQQIVLAGFSQGACLTAEYAVRHAGRYRGILLFTGGLIGPPGTRWEYAGSFDSTPILISGNITDAWVPAWRLRESAALFTRMDGLVVEQLYAGDSHLITDEEIAAARGILGTVAS